MAADQHSSGAPWRNFYGRFKGKTLRPGQEEALESDLAQLSPGPVSWTENPDRTALDLTQMFNASAVWLEIGFGGGEHLVHQAVQNPETGLIGCEPYINGVAMLLQKIRRAEAQNIRIYPSDARHLFDVLPPASISKAFLLYPDPWPKRRHHRRRFVTPEHLAPLARVLKPGAEFRVATDIVDYVRQTLLEVPKQGFAYQNQDPKGRNPAWSDWISTRYEQKALREGRMPHYLTFHRL